VVIGTNFPLRGEYNNKLQALIETSPDPTAAFAAAQLNYIELALKRNPLDREAVHQELDQLRQHGLQANFHPYYNCLNFGTDHEDASLRPRIITLLEIAQALAQAEGRPIVINFHAVSAFKTDSRPALFQQSHHFFEWMMETVAQHDADVIITAEHQLPPESESPKARIGDTFEELLALDMNDDRFGFCWDMGHSVMGHLLHHAPLTPPTAFLTKVRHIHIHDVDFEQQLDHRLIGSGNSPLKDFIHLLKNVGYQDAFTMEYNVTEFYGENYTNFLHQSRQAMIALLSSEENE